MSWPALAAARAHDASARVPFFIDGSLAGSVARAHLPALQAWPQALAVEPERVTLRPEDRDDRDAALSRINAALRDSGLVRGWRDETYTVVDLNGGRLLAHTERAAARFWGTLSFGAHANGYLADAAGRPTHLWVATRSPHKPTDPGLLDNLVGGGVPAGQSPWQALQREGFEEAGLPPQRMRQARPGRVLRLQRDITEGLQRENLHAFDLLLPRGLRPINRDGEVARFDCLPVAEALALASDSAMTVDAALVTLDFAWRHRLLPAADAAALGAALSALSARSAAQGAARSAPSTAPGAARLTLSAAGDRAP